MSTRLLLLALALSSTVLALEGDLYPLVDDGNFDDVEQLFVARQATVLP